MHRYLMWSLRRILWRMTPPEAKRQMRGAGWKMQLLRLVSRMGRR